MKERKKSTNGHFNDIPTNINFSKIWRRTNVADALKNFNDVRTNVGFYP